MSKKLEGNGRWESSRMMLPEHREQYLQRKEQAGAPVQPQEPGKSTPAQLPTKEELELIREFVLLPIMMTIVDKNCTEIGLSSYSMKSLYIKASQVLMTRIHDELSAVRKEMKRRQIKVFEDERVDSAIHYHFICRGYRDTFAMMRDVVRAEMSVRIARYVAEMFKAKS
ncbi:hypothetical protein [Paenibacillus montanisoli]|uniref:Uncharacterized protein n=1 Tax=Paenibacillus montanisoli TaxID=2081970 RepID=A0A328TZY9_9BACL|nr:hypothetical protein [Paenibacillus montanisoli]RAP76127.1 hypothetical protein DL346_11965 [Paenibacillus montanisoli]